jgi:SAM-dependent methyltransferase
MKKQGPGDDFYTIKALHLLPTQQFSLVVDARCGTGRQTFVLAKELSTLVHAIDTHQPFLNDLTRRAQEAGIDRLIQTHCIDMKDIPATFPQIDLLWSEGAAYSIGFSNALNSWAPAINTGGFLVVSEMAWLHKKVPKVVKEFFQSVYPGMHTNEQICEIAETAGYQVLETFILPDETWEKDYYDILETRAKSLLDHPDSSVIDFATDIIKEIEIFLTATKKVTVIPSLFFNGFNTFFDSVTSFKKGMMSLKTLLMMVTIENIKKEYNEKYSKTHA